MYFLLTVSAVVFAIRKPPTISSLSWSAFATAIFGVAAYSSFHNRSILIFFAYAVVDCLWFLLTVDAGMRRYKARKKALQNSGRTAAANPEHHE